MSLSVFMTFSHLIKIPIFGMIGVSLWEYITVVLIMVAGSVTGSWLDTKVRLKTNNEKLFVVIKWLLTILATNMVARSLFSIS